MTEASNTTSSGVWVVGVDGSTTARHAALWALRHGRTRASVLRLVSAWSTPSAPALPPIGPMRKYWDVASFERDARVALERLAGEFRSGEPDPRHASPDPAASLAVEARLDEGASAAVLLEASLDGDLLVLGARGRGGFGRLILGSTSTQCATHGHVPTAVIPAGAPISDAATIVVAVDGSENSITALRWALDFAAPGTTVHCVSVWEVAPMAVVSDPPPLSRGEAAERFQRLIDETSRSGERSPDASVTVVPRLTEGDPRSILAEAASAADLLVMGARGRGGVSAVLLGSVSTWLLHHVQRPMVVVPHPAPAA